MDSRSVPTLLAYAQEKVGLRFHQQLYRAYPATLLELNYFYLCLPALERVLCTKWAPFVSDYLKATEEQRSSGVIYSKSTVLVPGCTNERSS